MRRRIGLVVLALSMASTERAAAQIVLPGTQPGALQQPLQPAAQCTECHSGSLTSDGRTYLPSDTWPTSLMAHAERDPLFLAALTVAEQDVPTFGQYCLRCHSPAAFTDGHAIPGDGSHLSNLTDTDGVHCDTCHRSFDAHAIDPSAPYVGNARLFFDDAPPGMQVTRHGPYTDPFASGRHASVGDAFIRDSRLCGQCHDVDNPLVHRRALDGTDTGAPFPLQTTYSEYAQSAYARPGSPMARTCQGCHMSVESEMLPASSIPNAPLRANVARHEVLGGNEMAMALLRAAYAGMMDDAFDAARVREQTFLQTAARVEIVDAPMMAPAGSTVPITVRVTNLTGHKLPTGFEDARVMWLQIAVGDTVVSGAYVNDALVEDAQLRAYRFVPGHFVGTAAMPEQHIALHDTVLEDTRIPPLGMVPTASTQPVGRDYTGGPGGALRNDDNVVFRVALPARVGATVVTARLMYQFTSAQYVQEIAAANHHDDHGTRLLAAWNASGRAAPFAMAMQQTTVQLSAAPVDAGSDVVGADAAMDGGNPSPSAGCHCRAGGSSRGRPRGASTAALVLAMIAGARTRRARRYIKR